VHTEREKKSGRKELGTWYEEVKRRAESPIKSKQRVEMVNEYSL